VRTRVATALVSADTIIRFDRVVQYAATHPPTHLAGRQMRNMLCRSTREVVRSDILVLKLISVLVFILFSFL